MLSRFAKSSKMPGKLDGNLHGLQNVKMCLT